MLPSPATLALPSPEKPFTTQTPLPLIEVSKGAGKTGDQGQGTEMAKGKKVVQEGPQPKNQGKEVRPPTKAKDTENALTIKDVVSKAKGSESKPKADDPKKDPPHAKA